MLDYHKKLAQMGRWRHLGRKNNPALNPLRNGKNNKKNRKNKHKKKKHSSRKSDKKNSNDKQQKDAKDDGRFPPKGRLGSKDKKD